MAKKRIENPVALFESELQIPTSQREGTAEDRKAAAARMEADSPQGQSGMEAGKGGATNGSYRPGLSRHRLGTRTMSGQPVKLPESKKSITLFARLKVKFVG